MAKITRTQRNILSHLLYPEPYERLLDETGLSAGELRDDLINLINHGYIEVMEDELGVGHAAGSRFYDADNLQDFCFRATNKGLKRI